MPPALAARLSHIAICENGLGFIWNGPSQEACFFHHRNCLPQTRAKDLSPSEWWNGCQHIPLSSSLLPCAQQEPKCQDINPVSQHNPGVRQGGGGWFYNIITGALWNFSRGIPGVGTGVHILLSRVNVTWECCPWLRRGNSHFWKLWKNSENLKSLKNQVFKVKFFSFC